jgi:cold shock protein
LPLKLPDFFSLFRQFVTQYLRYPCFYLKAYLYPLSNTNTMSATNKGTVKFFNSEKGFGFIKHDDSSKETFVHSSGLIDQVSEGDKVEFDLKEGKKGMNAVNVKKIN